MHPEDVDALGHRWSLMDPRLFWRKLAMLVFFFGLFVPIYYYRTPLAFWYAVFLLLLHVYVLFVFLWRIEWRVLAVHRRAFAARLFTIGVFVVLLMVIRAGATLAELAAFVVLSGLVHVGILLALCVQATPLSAPIAKTDS